jgi:hypothetical protein
MVTLTDISTGNRMTVPVSIACAESKIINQMSPQNAKNIGFVAGFEYGKKMVNSI